MEMAGGGAAARRNEARDGDGGRARRDSLRPQRCIWSPLALRVEPWRLLARTGGSSNRVKYTVYCIVNFNTFLQKRDPSRFRFLRLFDPRHVRFFRCSCLARRTTRTSDTSQWSHSRPVARRGAAARPRVF